MDENDILDVITDWFLNFSVENNQNIRIDPDGYARISGEYDLSELAEYLYNRID